MVVRNKKARTGRASWVVLRLFETRLDCYLAGRGNLNRKYNLLFIKKNIGFIFCLECHLECQTLYVAPDRTVNHFVPCPRLLVSERWIT